MKLYHRTTEEAWAGIQAEGILFSTPDEPVEFVDRETYETKNFPRCTWFSKLQDDDRYVKGCSVLLEVDLEVTKEPFRFREWMSTVLVLFPIPIKDVKVIK